MKKWDIEHMDLEFLDNDNISESVTNNRSSLHNYKMLIADDDEEVHKISSLMLKDFEFEGRHIEILHTYSGQETIEVCKENPDIAILFLDVVMESNSSGFQVIQTIREELGNNLVRIILRTGEPGQAPEEEVIKKYDINDYRLKTELTYKRFNTTLYSALRNYRDLINIENHRIGLEKIIKASSRLFRKNTFSEFSTTILEELSNFHKESYSMVYVREEISNNSSGFVSIARENKHRIYAATGKYSGFIGKEIIDLPNYKEINNVIDKSKAEDQVIHSVSNGFIIKNQNKSEVSNFIFIEGATDDFDFDLIKVFLSNFSMALDNYMMSNMLQTTQREIIFALAETIESHYEETGSHVQRVAKMMYNFATIDNYSNSEAEMLALASSTHDLGKIAIPETILKKPGKLTEEEFEIIKTHTTHGHKILSKSMLPAIRLADEIAFNHHEKFNGLGYPRGIQGSGIPESAKMMAIIDVFDALTHKRVYKDAMSVQDAVDYIGSEKGKHFDPRLVDLFVENLDAILGDINDYS